MSQALEIDQDLPCGLVAELAVLFKQLPDDPAQVGRALDIEPRGRDRGVVQYCVEDHRGGDAVKCLLNGAAIPGKSFAGLSTHDEIRRCTYGVISMQPCNLSWSGHFRRPMQTFSLFGGQ